MSAQDGPVACDGMQATEAADVHALGRIVDPFAGVVRTNRLLVVGLMGIVAIAFGFAFRLSQVQSQSRSLVYEIAPDGEARYLAEREASAVPRASEAVYVAKHFVSLVFELNSSTVARDLAAALTLCDQAFSEQLRRDIASKQQIEVVRNARIRSEVQFSEVHIVEQGRTFFKLDMRGEVRRFSLIEYDRAPFKVAPVAVRVHLAVVPRDPEKYINGLAVTHMELLARDELVGGDKS
jgi:hypothetical protein